MNEITKKWYVVRTSTSKEKKVKQHLEKEIDRYGLTTVLTQILIPTEKKYQIKNGKKSIQEKNFYPGYVLVETIMSDKIKNIIKSVPDVLEILGAVRNEEINYIIKNEEIVKNEKEPFLIGETVKIVDGPFNNFKAIVDEINESKKRIKVIVNIFDRTNAVELDFSQISKI